MMEWIQANYVGVGAIITALYLLARAIVAITPTETDNEWVKKYVQPFVSLLSKVFGLDLTQGVKGKSDGMGITILLLFTGSFLVMANQGCNIWKNLEKDPEAQLTASADLLKGVVKSLTDLHKMGQLGEDETQQADKLIKKARGFLKSWESALENGEPWKNFHELFIEVFEDLSELDADAKGKVVNNNV